MSQYGVLFGLVLALCAGTGCRSPYHSDQLALFGGATGASLGAALSGRNGNTAENSILGGAIGAVTGAAVGHHIDAVEARNQALFEQSLGRQLAGAVTMQDVVAMSAAGLSDEVIGTHIARHGVARPLNAQDLIALKQQNVSDAVIQIMQAPPPMPAAGQVVVPAPPPPPVVIGGVFGNHPHPRWRRYPHHHYRHHHEPRRFSWGISYTH